MSVDRLDARSDDANPDTWEYEPKRPVISKRDFIGALRDWRRGDRGLQDVRDEGHEGEFCC